VGGKDGTLKNRLNSRVIAKTGTLNNVQNLSGYIDGDTFSIMLNGVTNQKYAKKFIDEYITANF
jgi:D-alanyl-D-alanine carboxypeptidase